MTKAHTPPLSRRSLLGLAVTASTLAVAVRAAAQGACIDPDDLTEAELSLRASLKFQEKAPDPAKPCQRCAFFTADEKVPACGECKLLNGPVGAGSWCSSWAGKT